MLLGSLITKKRKDLEISQIALATRLGLSNDYLCKIEKGEKLLSKVRLKDISKILKLEESLIEELCLVDKILLLIKKENKGENIKHLLLDEYRKYI